MKLEESEKGDSGGPVVRGGRIPGTFDHSQKPRRNMRNNREHKDQMNKSDVEKMKPGTDYGIKRQILTGNMFGICIIIVVH